MYAHSTFSQGSTVIPQQLVEQEMGGHVTERKRRKVVSDQEDDSSSDGESVSGDESSIEASSDEGGEGADSSVPGLKIQARTKQKKKKSKQKGKEADTTGGHSSANVSGLFDAEAIEDNTNVDFDQDFHGVETEEDQASEDGSGGIIHIEAVEDNGHLEFEEDFAGEDSEEEADGVDSTDEDVGGSDSETDESDDDESEEFGSFVVEDEEVEYASEDDGLDQLDEEAEMVSKRKRGAHFLEDSMEGEESDAIEQGSLQKADTSSKTLHKAASTSVRDLSHQTTTNSIFSTLPRNLQGGLQRSVQPARLKQGVHFMDRTDSNSDHGAAEDGVSESKGSGSDEGVFHSSSGELTSEREVEEGSSSEENEEENEEVGEEIDDGGDDDDEEEEEEGQEEEEREEESEGMESATGDNPDSVVGALQWKTDLSTRAASSFLQRQQKKIDLQKLIYDPEHSLHLQQSKGGTVAKQKEGEEIGGIFTPRVASTDIQHMEDVTRKSQVVVHDWTQEDLIVSVKDLMVTGRWGEEEDAQTLLQQDQDLYGDFVDLETGEKHSAKEEHAGGAEEGKGLQSLFEKKRQLKEAFDKEHDIKEGEKDYFSELKDIYSRQAEMNRQEFEGMDESLRLQLEGARVGSYVRIETRGMPCEFIENLDPHYLIIVGGLLPGETRLGYVTVRIKRHHWYKRILKSSDPLILSLGWRRFQTLPVYFKREDNLLPQVYPRTPPLQCHPLRSPDHPRDWLHWRTDPVRVWSEWGPLGMYVV